MKWSFCRIRVITLGCDFRKPSIQRHCPLLLISLVEAGAEQSSWIYNQSVPMGSVWDCPWGLIYMCPQCLGCPWNAATPSLDTRRTQGERSNGWIVALSLLDFIHILFLSLFFLHLPFLQYLSIFNSVVSNPPGTALKYPLLSWINREKLMQPLSIQRSFCADMLRLQNVLL